MGQTLECMKEGYSKIRNEALAYAFSYMNLIEHWGSGRTRIIRKVKAVGLRELEFIGGEVDLRINIYRRQTKAVAGADKTDTLPDSADKAPDNATKVPDNADNVSEINRKMPDNGQEDLSICIGKWFYYKCQDSRAFRSKTA